MIQRAPISTLFPYTTLFRSHIRNHIVPRRLPNGNQSYPCHGPSEGMIRASSAIHAAWTRAPAAKRSEEHTSELQSRFDLVCRLLLEKKKRLRQPTASDDNPR